MDVAYEVAELLLGAPSSDALALFCKPDGADTVCAYGILKILLFHCCRDMKAYTDCTSLEILKHHVEAAQRKGGRILIFINCYAGKQTKAELPIGDDVTIIVLDSRSGRKRSKRAAGGAVYILGGTEEEILKRVHERDLRMDRPRFRYHGTPASLSAYHICISMTPSFKHPNALWRAIVGSADAFARKRIHRDQYMHIHEYLTREVEMGESLLSIKTCDETCINFFHQSSLWEALHMSPHLIEEFGRSGFEDFIANTLGFPQNIAEYSYYQFVTGPGSDIWDKLESASRMIGIHDLIVPGFQRKFKGFEFHAMDHALAVNVALSHERTKQLQADVICVYNIFREGERVMGEPENMIPHYVQIIKTDCENKRKT